MNPCAIALIVAVSGLVACGKSPEQQQVEQIQKNAQQMAQSAAQASGNAQDLAKDLEAMARGMAAAATGGVNAAKQPVDPVDFKELRTMLPELSDWDKSQSAERMTAPVSFSYASARYKKAGVQISEKITDSGFNQLLIAPLTMMMATGYAKENDDGFEKSTSVGGYPAFEKWDKTRKRGELTVFVNQRFVVEVEGSGLADSAELQAFLARTDLKKLAALK